MSPVLFAIYVDSVILALQHKKLGARFGFLSVGVFMYADDLILISSSVSEMQTKTNICSAELSNLDLTINVKKSACIRIGKRYQQICSVLTVDSIIIPWSSKLTYLGVAIKASAKFSIDLKPNRTKFYRSFKSVYNKISKANETVIVSLVQTFCMSATMYGLEALVLNATLLRSLDNLLFRAFCKIFKTFDRSIVNSCMYYMNVWPLKFEYYNRRIKFLRKISKCKNNIMYTCFNVFGSIELSELQALFGIGANFNLTEVKHSIWQNFASNI